MSEEVFRFTPALEEAGRDIQGLSVVARDGDVGSVEDVVATPSGHVVVVSTGMLGFGKGRTLPAGLITEIDHEARLVRVDASSEQIKEAPKLDEDVELESRLLDHFKGAAPAPEPLAGDTLDVPDRDDRSAAVPQESRPLVAGPFASPEPEAPQRDDDVPAADIASTEASDVVAAESPTAPEAEPAEAARIPERSTPPRERDDTKTRRRRTTSGTAKRNGRRSVPIARYDSLSVGEILPKLRGLSQSELTQVERYERAHESRKTVLERIAALRGDQPWRGYDDQKVADVKKKLAKAQPESARFVRDYERKHKDRSGVVQAAQRRLQEV